MSIFKHCQSRYESVLKAEYSLEEYLELCGKDPSTYATAAEILRQAYDKSELVDLTNDQFFKNWMDTKFVFCLKDSPINESPLVLFDAKKDGDILKEYYGIPKRYLGKIKSPWVITRLKEYRGDISQFRVVKLPLSQYMQINEDNKSDDDNEKITLTDEKQKPQKHKFKIFLENFVSITSLLIVVFKVILDNTPDI